jgi:multimeric flavodoxin WrbA
MEIVAILGSPRKFANSTILAEEAIAAVDPKGLSVKKFVVNDLKAIGCQACYSCKGKMDRCAIKDDLTGALSAAASADFLVLASPVFIGDISAQAKIFVDRTFSWMKPDFYNFPVAGRVGPGKKFFFVQTQGNPDASTYKRVFNDYLSYFKWLGFKADGIVATDLNALEAVKSRSELLSEVRAKALALWKS